MPLTPVPFSLPTAARRSIYTVSADSPSVLASDPHATNGHVVDRRTTIVFQDVCGSATPSAPSDGQDAGRKRWSIQGPGPVSKLTIYRSHDLHVHLSTRLLTSTLELFDSSRLMLVIDLPPDPAETTGPRHERQRQGEPSSPGATTTYSKLGTLQLDPPLRDVTIRFARPEVVGALVFAPKRGRRRGEALREDGDGRAISSLTTGGSSLTVEEAGRRTYFAQDGGRASVRGFRNVCIEVELDDDDDDDDDEDDDEGGLRHARSLLRFYLDEPSYDQASLEGTEEEEEDDDDDGAWRNRSEPEQFVLRLAPPSSPSTAALAVAAADPLVDPNGETVTVVSPVRWRWVCEPLTRREGSGYPVLPSSPAAASGVQAGGGTVVGANGGGGEGGGNGGEKGRAPKRMMGNVGR